MLPVRPFYFKLEQKCCSVCGSVMTEQAESYMTECFQCQEESREEKYANTR